MARRGCGATESRSGTAKLMRTIEKMISFATGRLPYRGSRAGALVVGAFHTPAMVGMRKAKA
jgi:hypothetical protein